MKQDREFSLPVGALTNPSFERMRCSVPLKSDSGGKNSRDSNTTYHALTEDLDMLQEEFEPLMKCVPEKSKNINSISSAAPRIASDQQWTSREGSPLPFHRIADTPLKYGSTMHFVRDMPTKVKYTTETPHSMADMTFLHCYFTEVLDSTFEERIFDYDVDGRDLKSKQMCHLGAAELTGKRIIEWRTVNKNHLSGRDPVVPEYSHGN